MSGDDLGTIHDFKLYVFRFRVVSSDVKAAEGVFELMERFNWTRVAVITQQESIFTSVRSVYCVAE